MSELRALALDDPWQVKAEDFPETGIDKAKLLFLTNYAVLAPSILNVQPWRFRITDGSMDFFADRSRMLPVADPAGRELTVSCGAALLNLRVAALAFGHDLQVETFPDRNEPDLLARLRLSAAGPASAADRRLRDAILARRTDRAAFEDRQPQQDLLDELGQAARREGATLAFIHRIEDKRRAAELVAEAERIHLTTPEFRTEISDWIRRRQAEGYGPPAETSWGIGGPAGHTPPAADGPDLFTQKAADLARTFASPDAAAAHQYASAEASPVLALLVTQRDTAREWLAAGQALERALLTATAAGLSASYLNPPIELVDLRRRLAPIFGLEGHPQVLMRFGYGQVTPPSPRRPVSAVVEWQDSR